MINDLLKPNTVIAPHANEAGTQAGKVRAGTKTERFIQLSKVPVVVPLSGRTTQFDGNGRCTAVW